MDIRLLKTFLMVAQLQNITQAAERLNFSQPTITGQIQSLEEIFGVLLFERQGKKLMITEAGIELSKHAEKILAYYNETQISLEPYRKQSAALTLSVSAHLIHKLLTPVLREYQKRVPEGSIAIHHCANIKETLNSMQENPFYIGLIHDRISHDQFELFKIAEEEVIWLGHRDLLVKYNPSGELSQFPFINYTSATVFRNKFNSYFKETGCNSTIEYSDTLAVKQAVINGLGISILPYSLVKDEIQEGILVQIKDVPRLFLDICVLFKRSTVFSPAVYKFLRILSEMPNADENLRKFIESRKLKKKHIGISNF